jgi:hypothetical protein
VTPVTPSPRVSTWSRELVPIDVERDRVAMTSALAKFSSKPSGGERPVQETSPPAQAKPSQDWRSWCGPGKPIFVEAIMFAVTSYCSGRGDPGTGPS